jgi:hypothetical protein
MSQESVEKFLGRIITDSEFRESARESLVKACAENGLFFTDEELAAIEKLDLDVFAWMSYLLDKGIMRGVRCGG